MTKRIVYNVTGQTLTHVPSTRQSSIAWRLEDLRYDVDNTTSRLLDSGTAAVDTATEATTAAAGPGQANPRLITMASTAGFAVGTIYEISGTGGVEFFEVAAVTTNTSITATLPLIGTYATSSTVQGRTHTTAAILAAVVQDEDLVTSDVPMRIVWVYADGTRHQEQVRLVRDNASDLFVAQIVADCRETFPDLDTRSAYHGRDVITPWARSMIRQYRADALEKRIKIEEWLGGEQGHWAVVWRTLYHLARLGNVPANVDPREWAEYCKGEYTRRWDGLVVGLAGSEVLKQESISGTAASEPLDYRPIFGEL